MEVPFFQAVQNHYCYRLTIKKSLRAVKSQQTGFLYFDNCHRHIIPVTTVKTKSEQKSSYSLDCQV